MDYYLAVIVNLIQLLLYIYLAGTVLVLFVFAFASIFTYKPPTHDPDYLRKIAVFIPAYREDEVIIQVVEDAMLQNYPKDRFKLIVIADSFDAKTIKRLQTLDIILFVKDFKISTKSRALNYALEQLDEAFEVACILDADNIMERNFLYKINQAFSNGYKAVQGHRVAKNMNTSFSILDAVSEEINNNIFRKGQRVMGLSSTLIGSAMAFDFMMFKELMAQVEVVGGFDKEIEMRLYSEGVKIEFLPDAYVYDEKVQNARVFSRQRRRWLSAQFHYFGKNFFPAFKIMVTRGNFEYFFKAVHYLQLPRILLMGMLFLTVLISYFVNSSIWYYAWLGSFLLLVLVFLLAIPLKFYNFRTLKASLSLPFGFVLMALSLLKIKGANEKFIHTKHTYNAFQIKRKFIKPTKK